MSRLSLESKRKLQRIAADAWPAKEIEQYGGWQLRANHGITSRANSVFPENPPPTEVEKAIDYAISFYKRRKITPQFQLTNFTQPPNLDEALKARGFTILMPTQVEIAAVDDLLQHQIDIPVLTSNHVTNRWIKRYQEMLDLSNYYVKIRRKIMERISQPKLLVEISYDGKIVSLALGVVHKEWVGLFSVTTDPEYRRLGCATAASCAIAKWAKELGVEHAYLQVESDNTPALDLYRKLGFGKYFDYWYRTLEVETPRA
ncbi:MAG: hypothetical protein BAJATHORv1_70027 [Candidatus Thorarchaeota archaeon]|nr:MAG: hypothetical protein BAJATHORv1_70027 [Candidatus Thorarchaeota archaeon]